MFDVGFSEMLVIGIVALVVIGPERLPGVARTIGHLMGRAQRYVNDVKRDIDREMQVEELRKLQSQMQETARTIESSVTAQVGEVKGELDKAQDTMNQFAQQSSDLTRLDDPLAAEQTTTAATTVTTSTAASTATPAIASTSSPQLTVAANPAVAMDSGLADVGADADSARFVTVDPVASPDVPAPAALSADVSGGFANQPAASVSGSSPAATASDASPDASEESADDGVERFRHEVDHIVPDYSEGIMGPNTSIKPDPVAPASGGSGSAGGAAGVSRTVLVHVDLPPVT